VDNTYRPPDGFLTMAQAQARWGVSKATAQKMVREAELEIYRDPRNKRVHLFKVDDVENLMRPVLKARAA
jgi:Fic family protein